MKADSVRSDVSTANILNQQCLGRLALFLVEILVGLEAFSSLGQVTAHCGLDKTLQVPPELHQLLVRAALVRGHQRAEQHLVGILLGGDLSNVLDQQLSRVDRGVHDLIAAVQRVHHLALKQLEDDRRSDGLDELDSLFVSLHGNGRQVIDHFLALFCGKLVGSGGNLLLDRTFADLVVKVHKVEQTLNQQRASIGRRRRHLFGSSFTSLNESGTQKPNK